MSSILLSEFTHDVRADDMFFEDPPFHVSGEGDPVALEDMTRAFADIVENAKRTRVFSRAYAVFDGDAQVAEVVVQVDKSWRRYLTFQQIGVDQDYQRRGIGGEMLRSLKAAAVRTSRMAHVQSTLNDDIRALLRSSFFKQVDGGLDYAWSPPHLLPTEPITWENWTTDVSWATLVRKTETAAFDAPVRQMVDFAKGGVRGAGAFARDARWFKPETDLRVISRRLGVPLRRLQAYRVQKQCYGSSSSFAKAHANCRVLNGWAVTASARIPLQHACLCAILEDGEAFVFDLVRDEPLYFYGVALRRDFEALITATDTFCDGGAAEFVVDALNFLQVRANDGEELHDVLARVVKKNSE